MVIEHLEHFENIDQEVIKRASGFINNGLLLNFNKIILIIFSDENLKFGKKNENNKIWFDEIINSYKFYLKEKLIICKLDSNSDLDKLKKNNDSIFIFLREDVRIRTDFLPKILQYHNYIDKYSDERNYIITSNNIVIQNQDKRLLANDSEKIPSKPIISNPLRSLFAINSKIIKQVKLNDFLFSQKNIGLSIIFSLQERYEIFNIPIPLLKIDTDFQDINLFSNTYLYGLTFTESRYIEENQENIHSFEIKKFADKSESSSFRYTLRGELNDSKINDAEIFAIIPFRDNFDFTNRCIDSFKSSIVENKLRLVLVDNGSEENEELNKIKEKADIYIRIDDAYNFSSLNNIALMEISKISSNDSDLILILNNDCFLFENTLQELIRGINISKDISACGCKLLFHNELIQHGGVGITKNKKPFQPHHFYHIDANSSDNSNENEQESCISNFSFLADGCTAACLLIKKLDFEQINGFDEDIVPSAHSDTFLYSNLKKLKKYIIYSPFAKALHYESYSRTFYYPDDLESHLSLIKMRNLNIISKETFII